MRSYDEAIELAKLCAVNARIAIGKDIAALLWRMALEFQDKAAGLDGGKAIEVGPRHDY